MTATACPRAGQTVDYLRCGTVQRARVTGWAYVTAGLGGQTVRGDALADPRYAAVSVPGSMAVDVTESDIVAVVDRCEHCGGPLTRSEIRNCDACRGYRHRTPAERHALYPDAFSALRRTPAPVMPI